MSEPRQIAERVTVAALLAALAACALYAVELVARPYAQALASGESIPYFARIARGFAGATVVFGASFLLPERLTSTLLGRAVTILSLTLGLCVFVAVVWR